MVTNVPAGVLAKLVISLFHLGILLWMRASHWMPMRRQSPSWKLNNSLKSLPLYPQQKEKNLNKLHLKIVYRHSSIFRQQTIYVAGLMSIATTDEMSGWTVFPHLECCHISKNKLPKYLHKVPQQHRIDLIDFAYFNFVFPHSTCCGIYFKKKKI